MNSYKVTAYALGGTEDIAIAEIEFKAANFAIASYIGDGLIKTGEMRVDGNFVGYIDYIEVTEVTK